MPCRRHRFFTVTVLPGLRASEATSFTHFLYPLRLSDFKSPALTPVPGTTFSNIERTLR